jgi:hypothetical protein
VITKIEEALEAEQVREENSRVRQNEVLAQEPVAWEQLYETIIQWDEGGGKRSRRELARRIIALYTHLAQPLSEWVNVKDKLPNDIDRVLCYVEEISDLGKSHFIWNCSYNPAHGFNGHGKDGIVTHWMTLPNPPQVPRAIEQELKEKNT